MFSIVVKFLPLCGEDVGSKPAGKLFIQNLKIHTPKTSATYIERAPRSGT